MTARGATPGREFSQTILRGETLYLAIDLSILSVIDSYMANQSAQLDGAFHALADPTRRAVLQRLGEGPAPVSELA